VLRYFLIACTSSTLLLDSARAQTQVVTWPPLTQLSASSLYMERPTAPLNRHLLAGEPPDTAVRQIKPTYWKEGGLVGGVASGVFFAWLIHGLCTYYDESRNPNCGLKLVGGAVFGGGLGFVLGALVGGQFPKGRQRASSDSADVR
jgi:hypothetical protein